MGVSLCLGLPMREIEEDTERKFCIYETNIEYLRV